MSNLTNEQILAIANLCINATRLSKSDAFFEYSAHTDDVHISIYENGWSTRANKDYEYDSIGPAVTPAPYKSLTFKECVAKLNELIERGKKDGNMCERC